MNTGQMILSTRNFGTGIPLSMGTALIVESDYAMVKEWEPHLLVSLPTLVRNLISALPRETDWDKLPPEDVGDAIISEMDELVMLVKTVKPNTAVTFTYPSYEDLEKTYPKGRFRTKISEGVARIEYYQKHVRAYLLAHQKGISQVISFPTIKLEKDNRATTLLTAYPIDLLSQYQFPKLTLLESNTGRVKPRKSWFTKLSYSPEETAHFRLPFNHFTLMLFGDGKMFLSGSIKLKRVVYQLAEKHRWNALSTEGRIRQSINSLPLDMKETKEELLSYL